MNVLAKVLKRQTELVEQSADGKDRFRQRFHLMPVTGWLNDPNGLCMFRGVCHAFFQYSPFDAEGGLKFWGHCTSENMVDWKQEGVALYPDSAYDCHGVYSGNAFLEDGRMYLYYTGNIKLDGDYDYIHTGREGNTVLTVSEDGKNFKAKKLLMGNGDYPESVTCHVRDPKVWKEGDRYYMIQGARTIEDQGVALLFVSLDKEHWTYLRQVTTREKFGYMWECPEYMEVGGQLEEKKELACTTRDRLCREQVQTFEVDAEHITEEGFRAVLAKELVLEYREGFFRMYFLHTEKEGVSGGRKMRCAELSKLLDVKILADVSSVEVFINGGEIVFSTRYYPDLYQVEVEALGAELRFWNINL